MLDVVRLPASRIGKPEASLRSNNKAAIAAATAPLPTRQQAIRATTMLMANWGERAKNKSDDEFNAFVDVLILFPVPIIEECVDSGLGIARTKTSKGEVREWPPLAPEVAAWCENLRAHCRVLANPPPRPVAWSSPSPASAESKARVRAALERYLKPSETQPAAEIVPDPRQCMNHTGPADPERRAAGKILARYARDAAPSVFELDPANWNA
jgi:hypothetical protein